MPAFPTLNYMALTCIVGTPSLYLYVCSNHLPNSTLTLWEQSLVEKSVIPKWSQLDSFLTSRYRTLESVSEMKSKIRANHSKSEAKSKSKGNVMSAFQTNVSQHKCRLCPTDSHIIRKCPRFLSMKISQRIDEIKKINLCLNCFSGVHLVRNCKSKHSCFKCGKRHNTLLHKELEQNTNSNLSSTSAPFVPQTISNSLQSTAQANGDIKAYFSTNSTGILLGTAMVNVCHSGLIYTARALLDSGSEGTFIAEKLFNRLRLPFKRTSAKVSGLNNSISADVQKQCSFVLGSTIDHTVEIPVTALVVPQLSGNLPSRVIDSTNNF